MNAAARALHEGNIFQGDFSSALFFRRNGIALMLWLILLGSALGVIYLRHIERDYFSQLQKVERQLNKAKLEYGQLLLEQSMWTSPQRIERLVKEKLNMQRAVPAAVIIIKQSRNASNQKWQAKQYAYINKPAYHLPVQTI